MLWRRHVEFFSVNFSLTETLTVTSKFIEVKKIFGFNQIYNKEVIWRHNMKVLRYLFSLFYWSDLLYQALKFAIFCLCWLEGFFNPMFCCLFCNRFIAAWGAVWTPSKILIFYPNSIWCLVFHNFRAAGQEFISRLFHKEILSNS